MVSSAKEKNEAGCYGMNVSVLPLKFICWSLIPNVIVVGDGTFGKWLGNRGGSLMNEVSALIKETSKSSLAPSTMWGYDEKTAMNEEASPYQTLGETDVCCLHTTVLGILL